ncbi:ribose 5-phosphate isomerase B [Aquiflexum sp.]|uniref:ribose 5-phosphate isomerase B n=1 Tax=Aquiflexum sp. TaxID=1872584 RepID=UPI00359329AF
MSKKIAIGGDHAGFHYKTEMIKVLETEGYEVKDFGPYSGDSADYPDFVHPLCDAIEKGEFKQGILICGSGNGVAITANKHQEIRAALCWTEDLASLARQHNDANVLALPARFIPFDLAEKMTMIFLTTEFEGGRHATRVSKIACK